MIRVRGFSIENNLYNNFLEWLQRAGLNEDLFSRDEFKRLLNEFKQLKKRF